MVTVHPVKILKSVITFWVDFHVQVLNTGGLPLPVLESKIDRWIANGGG